MEPEAARDAEKAVGKGKGEDEDIEQMAVAKGNVMEEPREEPKVREESQKEPKAEEESLLEPNAEEESPEQPKAEEESLLERHAEEESPEEPKAGEESQGKPKANKKRRRGSRRRREPWMGYKLKRGLETYKSSCFYILKAIHPELDISEQSVGVLNMFMHDLFEKLAQEGARIAWKKKKKPTLDWQHIEKAVKRIFPGEMAELAMAEAHKAMRENPNSVTESTSD